MAKHKRNQTQYAWLSLAKQAALEMDKSERDFEKAERMLVQSLELLAADASYPKEQRYIDENLIVSTLAFAYAGQQRLSLACLIADHVVERVCQKWPAYADADLTLWQAILQKMQQLYLACGQEEKALAVAVEKLDKINELANLLMEDSDSFPGCKVWADDVLPKSQHAVLQIKIEQVRTRESFALVKGMLLAS
jgi:hypothetical protein